MVVLTSTLLNESQEPHQTLCGFEGPEKTIEIWFKNPTSHHHAYRPASPPHSDDDDECPGSPHSDSILSIHSDSTCVESGMRKISLQDANRQGLRSVERAVWDDMLDIVKARILSVTSNEHVDAYLLSESSMFVYPRRIILKTCGTTTLLNALPKILEIADRYCGMTEIESLFYSRKAFLFPERQIFPHGKWGDEVEFLDAIFPSSEYETCPYVVGKLNSDHWCLYLATPLAQDSDEEGEQVQEEEDDGDVTLEVTMYGLDKKRMKTFWRGHYGSDLDDEQAQKVGALHETRIAELYPGSLVDDYLFDPCGYSMNGLVGPYYYTSHVTPEDQCSFASVETCVPAKELFAHAPPKVPLKTNVPMYDTLEDVVSNVVDIYQPSCFSVVLFVRSRVGRHLATRKQGHLIALSGQDGVEKGIVGFKVKDRVSYSLGKWEVLFMHFEKPRQV